MLTPETLLAHLAQVMTTSLQDIGVPVYAGILPEVKPPGSHGILIVRTSEDVIARNLTLRLSCELSWEVCLTDVARTSSELHARLWSAVIDALDGLLRGCRFSTPDGEAIILDAYPGAPRLETSGAFFEMLTDFTIIAQF